MAKARPLAIPDKLRFQIIDGEKFLRVRQAARLAGLPPSVLEMTERLLKKPGNEAAFIGLDQIGAKRDEARKALLAGLRRVAKALAPAQKLRSRALLYEDSLACWYEPTKGKGA